MSYVQANVTQYHSALDKVIEKMTIFFYVL
jgi:hypothetical protein